MQMCHSLTCLLKLALAQSISKSLGGYYFEQVRTQVNKQVHRLFDGLVC